LSLSMILTLLLERIPIANMILLGQRGSGRLHAERIEPAQDGLDDDPAG
jgi:hypothetical protein